jgi:cytochrome P450
MDNKSFKLTENLMETLRLTPATTLVPNIALEDIYLTRKNGETIKIPKGYRIFTNIHAIHHHAYEDPEEYKPERFQGLNPSRWKASRAGDNDFPHPYLPFSVGERMCSGDIYARQEMRLLSYMLHRKLDYILEENPDVDTEGAMAPKTFNVEVRTRQPMDKAA